MVPSLPPSALLLWIQAPARSRKCGIHQVRLLAGRTRRCLGRERGRDPSGQGSSSATALLGAVQVFPKDATAKFAVTPSGAVLSSAHPSRPHLPMALFPSPHPPGGTLRRESSQGSAEKRGRGGAQERGAAAGGRGCGRRGPAGAAPRGRRRRREGSHGGKRCRRPRRERRGGKAPVFAPPWSPRLHSCAFPPAPRLAELRPGGGGKE